MKIKILPLIPQQIRLLQDKDALFILDYRALGESLDMEIKAMWKYENMAPRILKNQTILVNQNSKLLKYPHENTLILVDTGEFGKTSIIKRATEQGILNGNSFNEIVTFIPHPDIDNYCQTNEKTLSYSYENFLIFNNKILQKQAVRHTPKRNIINDLNQFKTIKNKENYYIKKGVGSGGFNVFKADVIGEKDNLGDMLKDKEKRYIEEKVHGLPMSIQVYKDHNECTIFGFTKQNIKDEKEFYGAELLPLDNLQEDIFLIEKLEDCVMDLCADLLRSYNGFFGIDFIYDQEQKTFGFLEGNIRLTAMTIPTLLHNIDPIYKVFQEDVSTQDLKPSDIILGYDERHICYDVLRQS